MHFSILTAKTESFYTACSPELAVISYGANTPRHAVATTAANNSETMSIIDADKTGMLANSSSVARMLRFLHLKFVLEVFNPAQQVRFPVYPFGDTRCF